MMSAKMATPALLERKVFWNKDYYVIYYVYGVNNEILSYDSNYIMDVVMWPKFGNSSICTREVITTSILQGFDQKNRFLWGVALVQVQQFGTGTRYKLEILHQSVKKVKTKSQKFWGANSYVCRSYRGKTGRGGLFAPPPPPPTSWIELTYD